MAKINPVKIKADADKLEKAGKLDQAIVLYRQILEDNPRDWNTINKIGDLFAKLNKNREAGVEYAKVADFYAKDGFLLKAIAIWKKIQKLDASALDPYLNLADLYAKQGLMMEAKSQYQIVVDEYIKRGKMRDAGDVLKKMADIDPGDLKVRSKLADLYTRDGNAGKAVEEHIAIADELTKKGHLAEALQVLEKGLKIDAKSNRLRGELARIHLVQKNYERAAHFLEEAASQAPNDRETLAKLGEAYLGGKKIQKAEATFKRLLDLDPNDQDARVQMARVFLMEGQLDRAYGEFEPVVDKMLERREGEKAALLLQQVVQANPAHVKSLLKLVEIYKALGKEAPVVSTYSQLTEAYTQEGQWDQAAGVLEILVSMEPQNQQHKTKLQFVKSQRGSPAAASPVAAAPLGQAESVIEEEEFDLSGSAEPPAFTPTPSAAPKPAAVPAATGAAVSRPSIEASGPLSAEDREFIEEHLAEGRVFRKYGLVDKAADQFESVIARFPDNADSRQELREVYKEKGQNAKAAEQCLALAEIFRLKGDAAEAEAQEAEAARLAPEAAPKAAPKAAPAPAAAKPAAPKPKPAPPPPPPVEEEEAAEEEIALPEAEEEIPVEVEEAGLETPSFDLGPEPGSEPPSLDLGEELGGEELQGGFLDEEPAPRGEIDIGMLPEEEPPPVPAAEEELPLAGLAEAEEFPLGEPEPPPPPPPPAPLKAAPAKPAPKPAPAPAPPPPALKAPPPPPPPSGLPADLQKTLDEVDSYVSLGFVDDAKDALREIGARYPSHPAILEKIAELGLDQEVIEEAPAAPVTEELDLGEPAAPPDLELPQVEEASPLEEALGDLTPPEPELPTEALGEPEFPEPALPEPAFAEQAFGEPAFGEPTFGEPAFAEPELPEPPAAEPAAEAQAEGGLDLGAELDDLFSAQSAVEEPPAETGSSAELGDAGLAEIFKEFKKGVDKQLGKEDYDTRYNLGIAYKEMGLIDEAIAEFQLAAKDEARLLECSSMLGICFVEKGMPKLAVKWFEKGLKAPGRTDEEYQGLRYDLALAHEAAGEIDKAYAIYSELYGQDANFRDVSSKVRELKAALG